ncbi:AGE family epimerase/isomerase [Natronoflexus pectinivorans]|uniref:Cellobiose 2-epimerase n=1 Tax=Natronoflexus pectinivorans TaxID=682526 RepID=A0A4R2GRT1_9BACT|nr:AGE family epimerase/isomerase [Natronoflexus pectinivorans]TCO10866.1 mannobiose 2-epimerase [Natronoflexus pectinivorans]
MNLDVSKLKNELKQEYISILDFWKNHTADEENGGFYGELCNDGTPNSEAIKGVVLNTRILWTFASAYNFLKNEQYLKVADLAYNYIIKYFWDREFDGLFWSVDVKGNVHNDRKQIYAQGFGIYGFSEYFKATGNKESLDYAIKLFNCIEKYSFDHQHGGYIEALSRDWMPLQDMRLSEKDANEPKSMNTHLHIIEPYTNLFRVWPDDGLKMKMENLVKVFHDRIINPENAHFELFFDKDWTVKSEMVSYGHDIEGAWLLCEAADFINNPELLKQVESMSLRMTDVTLKEGLAQDNSLYYEKDPSTDHLDRDRHWWVQAEAMVGFMNAFQLSGKEKYQTAMLKMWDYIKTHIIDRENGEWHLRTNDQGLPITSDPKAGFWKCPYHNSRALMELYNRL